jgi:hypothetical protein
MASKPNIIEPNLYQLQGCGISVSYSTTGLDGKPHFSYQDAVVSKSFTGEQIEVSKTSIGSLVTVVLRLTPDAGSTTFTVLIPSINLVSEGIPSPVDTIGITTVHRFSIAPALLKGQIELYTTTPLTGTAISVVF